LGHQAAPRCIHAFHPYGGGAIGEYSNPQYSWDQKTRNLLTGASVVDIPSQGAGIANLLAVARESEHLVTGVGPCLVKKALFGCARRKLKKVNAKESEAITGGIQQPGHANAPRQ
jgi:hypothetical protein